jgi:hypothetical protein
VAFDFEDVVHHLADRRVLDAVLPAALLARLGDDVVLEVLVAESTLTAISEKSMGARSRADFEHPASCPLSFAADSPTHHAVAVLDQVKSTMLSSSFCDAGLRAGCDTPFR